eukprot:TRINITY_DN299_c0_g2_i1.p1 TRINITY_DN299_c0_g2~~TRINITY_DN299_c0_g2_i1.p1  ORF type:complete len:475 (+),score=110.55 TRINITY_DN299_c0_g2_i1:173-1597(+)
MSFSSTRRSTPDVDLFLTEAPKMGKTGFVKAKAVWHHQRNEESSVGGGHQQLAYGGHGGQHQGTTYSTNSILKQYAFWYSITIKEGERVYVWDLQGKSSFYDGPQRVTIWRSYYQYLPKHTAGPSEYISVEYVDGTKQNLKGPLVLWHDPVKHTAVTVRKCVSLNDKEVMIVYRRNPSMTSAKGKESLSTEEEEEDTALLSTSVTSSSPLPTNGKDVRRFIIKGPVVYTPTPDEWTHTFRWGGDDATSFTKLNTTPDAMEVQVEYVRTADDGTLDLSLMVYFELVDIEKMLEQTKDPITDITHAMVSDVILAISKTTFPKFKASTEVLNTLQTYRETLAYADKIGVRIHRVAFKGYRAGEALQETQDQAIRSRTKLMLEEEKERQSQTMLDLKLEKEQERAARQQELEIKQTKSRLELQRLRAEHELATETAMQERELKYLQSLSGLGVDITAYLVSRGNPKPDKLVKILKASE